MKRIGSPSTCVACALVVFLLAATGAGQLVVNPSTMSFGSVQIGGSVSQSVVLSNTASSNLTISQATVSGAGFAFSGLGLPATLAPGQSVNLTTTFAPQSGGSFTGSLSLAYSFPKTKAHGMGSPNSNGTATLSLTGTGTSPGQLNANPTSLNFANVQVGSSQTQSATLINSGGSSLTISAASASGTGFSLSGLALPLTLNAGQSTTFSMQFAPNATGAVSGNVSITSDGANPNLNIALSGTGVTPGALSASPTSLSFGSVQVGSGASLSETLTNTGGASVTISQANVTGTGFSITGLTLPTTLTPSHSVTFTAKFTPAATGAASSNLAIVSDASNSPLNIALSGTGTAQGQLSVSPGTLNFGNVVVGANLALTGSLTANTGSVTVTSGSSNSGEFVLSGITFPKTIAAGQSASFTVTFTPNASGAASASLTVLSNASNSPTLEALTGNGGAPPPHSINLSWNTSQSQGVVGYNIYRGTVSGSYSKINSSLNADTTYMDTTVAPGQTYFYVAKAVDRNNVESGPSNEVQVTVPNP